MKLINRLSYFSEYFKADSILKLIFDNALIVYEPIIKMFEYQFYDVHSDKFYLLNYTDKNTVCAFYIRQKINLTYMELKDYQKLIKHLQKTDFSDLEILIENKKGVKVVIYVENIKYHKDIHELEYLILVGNVNSTTDKVIKNIWSSKKSALNGK